MKTFESILNIVSRIVEWVTCTLLVALALITSWQVFSRYVLNTTPSWSEEICIILVVWFGMLGAGLGIRDGTHLSVEFVVRGMGEGARKFFHRLSHLLVMAFSTLMVAAGFRLVFFVHANQEINPATGIPVSLTYLAIPLSGIFIFLHALKHLIELYSGKEDILDQSLESTIEELREL